MFRFEFSTERTRSDADVVVERHVVEFAWKVCRQGPLDSVRQIQCCAAMFHGLGGDAHDDSECVTGAVVARGLIHIYLVISGIDGWVGLPCAGTEDVLVAVFVEDKIVDVMTVPHLKDETKALFVEDVGIKGVVFGCGRQCDVERRGVAGCFGSVVVSLVLAWAVPARLLCLDEIDGVNLEPHGFFSLPVMSEDFVEVVF